ncbi:MAG: flavodoxin domain-containing protein [Clostridia bacterium]|nr:flavodoxin domain-containing protein [Clostridia bacterium]
MSTVVVYKSKYGSTKQYAEWIAEELGCEALDAKKVKIDDLEKYDTIVYGGGLYAEVINGVILLTKNMDKLEGKKLIVYSTGITPLKYSEYYDKLVIEKNFKPEMLEKIKVYNFLGKMILDELTIVHRTALKTLKKIMQGKENPTEMEKLLVELCDANGDFSDREAIKDLVEYAKQ